MDDPVWTTIEGYAEEIDMECEEWSRQSLRSAALELSLRRPRSVAWAVLLEALPSPQHDILTRLRQHRRSYEELKIKFTKDPRAVLGDDPLSQKDESAWKQHFCDNELKALILQDVVRTFPEETYFRQQHVQDLMVRVLFVWGRSHALGYRQGLHEVLAPLLLERDEDSRVSTRCEKLKEILNPKYLEHDSYMLFSAVMTGLTRFYWTGDVPTPNGRMPLSTDIHSPSEVVRYLSRLREEQLVPLDPELATHLHACNISLELFGIRWLRLLFGREFPRSETAPLWGFLFADGPALPHVHYLVLATLVSMREALLALDAGGALSLLMSPGRARIGYVTRLALHLREPLLHARPSAPAPPTTPALATAPARFTSDRQSRLEERGVAAPPPYEEGVAEGADVARELATLALLRARLPAAAAALAAALGRPADRVAGPLAQILQLSALLQCRNHALVDVETALEAAEGHSLNSLGQRHLVPVSVDRGAHRHLGRLKEVPLQVFTRVERPVSEAGLPCTDPLRLRTD